VARMFFVAHTRDGEDMKTRPVSFLDNGGPGAATVWLHMGSFARTVPGVSSAQFHGQQGELRDDPIRRPRPGVADAARRRAEGDRPDLLAW